MRAKKIEQICEELARTVGAALDSCIVAWDDSAAPRIVFATGHTEGVLQAKAGDLVGQPAATLFSGGERAAKDLAAACANVPAEEQRPMMRGGKPFPAQLLLRGVNGGAVAVVRDLTAGHEQADAALRAEDLARFASLLAHEVRNPLSAVKIALQTLERHGTLAQNDSRIAAPLAGSCSIHQWPTPSRRATCAPRRSAMSSAMAGPPVNGSSAGTMTWPGRSRPPGAS